MSSSNRSVLSGCGVTSTITPCSGLLKYAPTAGSNRENGLRRASRKNVSAEYSSKPLAWRAASG